MTPPAKRGFEPTLSVECHAMAWFVNPESESGSDVPEQIQQLLRPPENDGLAERPLQRLY